MLRLTKRRNKKSNNIRHHEQQQHDPDDDDDVQQQQQANSTTTAAASCCCIIIMVFCICLLLSTSYPFLLIDSNSTTAVNTNDVVFGLFSSTKNRSSVVIEEGSLLSSSSSKEEINTTKMIHVVFSTDCSGYQHWQSIALWYSLLEVNHQGPVTRIASGCSFKQQNSIIKEWNKIDPTKKFRIHFTPQFSLKEKEKGRRYYRYSNKPGGIYHWLQHASPSLNDDDYICLVDPDMLFLRPIEDTLNDLLKSSNIGLTRLDKKNKKNQVEYIDSQSETVLALQQADMPQIMTSSANDDNNIIRIGQHFGQGGLWASKPEVFNRSYISGDDGSTFDSPVTNTSQYDADKYYSVGPVYITTKKEWISIGQKWWDFVPRVHDVYPNLLAEMYAYTMSIADLEKKFTLLSSFMISDPVTQSPTEAWSWIDDLVTLETTSTSNSNRTTTTNTLSSVCNGANLTQIPYITRNNKNIPLPTTLHYCQRYIFGTNHKFFKREIQHDFFNCGEPSFLKINVDEIITKLEQLQTQQKDDTKTIMIQTRSAFMICHVIPMINSALVSYQKDVCNNK